MLAMASGAMGFSLLGPGAAEGNTIKDWQLPGDNDGWEIGYNVPGDIGGPMDIIEAYRWNTPIITYAYDNEFIRYFGPRGIKAVDDAIRILNELPAANKMSADLSEFPLSSSHLNVEASQLGLMDLKSVALQTILEELGLADPVRWNFSIHHREAIPSTRFGVYGIVRYNFDPVTLRPSSYINGTLYTYRILETPAPPNFSEAVEQIPPGLENEPINFPVAANSLGGRFSLMPGFPLISGYYYTGLSRDDVGALRYLLRPDNVVVETLLPDIVPGGGKWSPFIGTNFLGTNGVGGTNNIITAGLRGGVNKLQFKKVHFDGLLGQTFTPVRFTYSDRVTALNRTVTQGLLRTVALPDIIFTVADTYPAIFGARTTTATWINNDPINGSSALGGPGVIPPTVFITFNTQNPVLGNQSPFFVTEPLITDTNARAFGLIGPVWASFDGSTNDPIIYPDTGNSFRDIRNMIRQLNP